MSGYGQIILWTALILLGLCGIVATCSAQAECERKGGVYVIRRYQGNLCVKKEMFVE